MLRSLVITIRIHRSEIAIVGVALLLVATAIVLVTLRLLATGATECFAHDDAACPAVLENFYRVRDGEASYLRGTGASLIPVLAGLVLGVPLIGREIELRTASLAWSLSANRSRWLRQRVMPMLTLLVLALAVVGSLAVLLGDIASPDRPRAVDSIGAEGISFVARGVMSFGIATVVGAVMGRTLPAFLLAAALALVVALPVSTALTAVLANAQASWRDVLPDAEPPLIQLREAYRVGDGDLMTFDQVLTWFEGQPPGPDWERGERDHVPRVELVVDQSRYPVLEWSQTLGLGLIGIVALATTGPIVRRRRPL